MSNIFTVCPVNSEILQVAAAILGNAGLNTSMESTSEAVRPHPDLRRVICIDSDETQYEGAMARVLEFSSEDPNVET